MVLGLDCFGFMARKAPESSEQQEAEDARKKKDATEAAAFREASENKGEKAVKKTKKGRGTAPAPPLWCLTSLTVFLSP